MTALSSERRVIVQFARPPGAFEQAFATIFASASPVALSRAVSDAGLLAGVMAYARPFSV